MACCDPKGIFSLIKWTWVLLRWRCKTSDVMTLKKIPIHVGFSIQLVGAKLNDAKQAARLVLWSLDLGATHVTLYDVDGELVRLVESLEEECVSGLLNPREPELFGNLQRVRSLRVELCEETEGEKNERRASFEIAPRGKGDVSPDVDAVVRVIGAADSHPAICWMIRRMATRAKAAGMVRYENTSPPDLHSELPASRGAPELDLCLVSSRDSGPLTVDGFPPWMLKNAEIMYCGPYGSLAFPLFLRCVARYAKVEQRWGR